MKISVLTVTNRKGGIDLLKKQLPKQTLEKNFEWIIVSPLDIDVDAKVIPDPPKKPGAVWNLNAAYNEGLRNCDGELIVSIQDFIWIPPNSLEKFWLCYLETGQCITGVGDIYSEDFSGLPTWYDPRKRTDQGTFYECFPQDWETNYAAAPRKAFYDIGGYDEELDKHFGMDNVSIALRMNQLGWKFFIDQTNECKGIRHDRPKRWDELHAMHGPYQERVKHYREVGWKLDYLK